MIDLVQCIYIEKANVNSFKYIGLILDLGLSKEIKNPALKKEISRQKHEEQFPVVTDFWWYLEPLDPLPN